MSLFDAQLIVLFLLLIGTFICGILPILCFRWLNCFSGGSTSNKVTSFLIFFGGGVLFATSLLHLLPEAREQLENASHPPHGGTHHLRNTSDTIGKCNGTHVCNPHEHHGHKHGFSFPEFIALCGFFATYLIEEIIRSVLRKKAENGTSDEDRIKFCSCAQRNTECSRTYKDLKLDRNDLLAANYGKRKRSSTWAGHGNQDKGVACGTVSSNPPPDLLRSSIISQPYPNYGATRDEGTTGLLMRLDGGITLVNRPVAAPPQLDVPGIVVIPESPVAEDPSAATVISIGSLLTVAALSFHSLFEGIAMGFQPSAADIWTLFFAVAVHKFVIAFVIGVEAVTEKSGSSFIIACMSVFSIMSPIGIGIAMSLGAGGSTIPQFVVGIVNSIATGTLLYVTFYEILRRKCQNFCGLRRFLATISGFLLMSGLLYSTSKM